MGENPIRSEKERLFEHLIELAEIFHLTLKNCYVYNMINPYAIKPNRGHFTIQ